MQTTNETTLTPKERRDLIIAGRNIIKLRMQAVTTAHGITTQNLYTWLKDETKNTLAESKQVTALKIFGLLPSGRLSEDCLHAWQLEARLKEHVDDFLRYETDISDVVIHPAFTSTTLDMRFRDSEPERILIGASVSWTAPRPAGRKATCRLIVTALDWDTSEFIPWLQGVFAARSRTKVKVQAEIDVVERTAEVIWRCVLRKSTISAERVTIPPNRGVLPLSTDIIGHHQKPTESAVAVLTDMTERFAVLSRKAQGDTNARPAPRDAALLRRAQAVISGQ